MSVSFSKGDIKLRDFPMGIASISEGELSGVFVIGEEEEQLSPGIENLISHRKVNFKLHRNFLASVTRTITPIKLYHNSKSK